MDPVQRLLQLLRHRPGYWHRRDRRLQHCAHLPFPHRQTLEPDFSAVFFGSVTGDLREAQQRTADHGVGDGDGAGNGAVMVQRQGPICCALRAAAWKWRNRGSRTCPSLTQRETSQRRRREITVGAGIDTIGAGYKRSPRRAEPGRGRMTAPADPPAPDGAIAAEDAPKPGVGNSFDCSAAEFEALLRTSPVALALARDPNCEVVLRNSAMDRIIPPSLDWRRWHMQDGTAPAILVAGRLLPIEQQPLRRAALLGHTTHQLEMELRWPGREPIVLLVNAEPLRNASGATCGAIGTAVDLTAQRRAEREQAVVLEHEHAARQAAEAASRAKDDLLAMLGHELRNPMNAIATAGEVLNRAAAGAPEAASARAVIGRQIRRLANLLDDLDEVGRVRAGDTVLTRHPVELGALLRLCANRAAAHAGVRGQRLNVDAAEVWVDGDAERLSQSLERLLESALRRGPVDGGIAVRLRAIDGAGGTEATLDVRDSGIEPDPPGRRVDPYVRAPSAPGRAGGDLDIGLTLARGLIERHGGRLEARSDGAESLFRLRLPAIPAPTADAGAKSAG